MSNNKTVWCISKYASPPHYGVGARLFYIAREFGSSGFDVLLISSDSNHLAKYPTSEEIYNFENCGTFEHMWIKTFKYTRSASLKRFISWIDCINPPGKYSGWFISGVDRHHFGETIGRTDYRKLENDFAGSRFCICCVYSANDLLEGTIGPISF